MPTTNPLQVPRPVQALPEGLLDVLGVKNAGRYPDELAGSIVGTLDLAELFNMQRYQLVVESALSLTGVGSTLTALTVPTNEIWWVRAYMWVCTLGAGMTCKFRVFTGLPQLAGNTSDDCEIDAGASGTTGDRIRAVKRNFWANSGWTFGAQAVTNTGGPITPFQASWLYVPFRR